MIILFTYTQIIIKTEWKSFSQNNDDIRDKVSLKYEFCIL